ncbi:MAG: OmpH family outer membrane protein [Verrucomicrobiota bacterium]|jgi:Skp family chaperone for outer membrane proteins
MRSFLSKVLAGLLLVWLLGSSAWAQGRIATVDTHKLLVDYYRAKQARAALDENKAEVEKEHANMVNDLKKLKEDYETTLASASDQIVSPEERDKRKKLAEDKLKRVKESEDGLGAYERSAQSRYEEQARRVQVRLSEEIRSVLEAKAKSAGCALVLDVAGLGANGSPIILYSNNENDLTQVILDELNAAAPPEALKTPEKPPAKKAEKKK